MSKDEVIQTIANLPGVGQKKAEALYDAGFDSIEKIKAASVEELQGAEGVGPKVAQAIYDGLRETGGAKSAVQVREKGDKATEAKTEVVEAEEAYRVKIKPELTDELRHALNIREIRKAQQPAFRRYHHWYRKGMDPDVWRAPKGVLSKQRRGFKYRPPRVKVGYGKPAAARGLHPSGFEEILVANPAELEELDPKTQAARVVGTVGGRKRALIESAAAEKGIRILNPRRT